jgi:hypothetical protein
LPLVLLKIGIGEEDTISDGVLNLFLLLGSLGGLWLVAKTTRRGLTIWSFLLLMALDGIGFPPDDADPDAGPRGGARGVGEVGAGDEQRHAGLTRRACSAGF